MGIDELVNQWNYDAGDLFGESSPYPALLVPVNWEVGEVMELPFYSEVPANEPDWETLTERVDAYEMVNRMLLGIPELDDYIDLKETEYDALGIGVQ